MSNVSKLLLTTLCTLIGFSTFAQRNCGTMEYLENQIKENPKQKTKLEQIEKQIAHYEKLHTGLEVRANRDNLPNVFRSYP